MRTGKRKYLFATFSLAKEGLDIPCLDRLYLTAPKKDKAVVEQSLGRISRTATDKLKKIAEKAKEQNLSTKQFILNAIEEKMKG